jgi:hypothetical protein
MKKFTIIAMLLSFFAVGLILASPQTASAQTYYRKVHRHGRTYWVRTHKPSYYRRHRNLINVGAATAGGALLGGIIGGRKGMLVGSGVGAGSGALYTYVLKPKKRHYKKVRRHHNSRRYRHW